MKCTWVHRVDAVSCLAVSTDESLLYSVSWDRTLKVWRTSDFKCLESVANAHEDAINSVLASADGNVYTGSADRRIKMWRKLQGSNNHKPVNLLETHSSGVNALAVNSYGSLLCSGSSDGAIFVWEKEDESGKMVAMVSLQGHSQSILCLSFVSGIVFSGSADKTIRIWVSAGKNYSCMAVLQGHQGPVKCLPAVVNHYGPSDSFSVYSGSLDCSIKVWHISLSPF
ncbi:hypothetical protein SAY87_010638 [Trapa incisa]|uniref:Uncharacterized protein n=1 Tax=Trapa incisa TaxID=236973 RepID=A0AAN7GEU7_9MYRT|nr:hypothetical protein SAY87_010638 [Trapa incisa]